MRKDRRTLAIAAIFVFCRNQTKPKEKKPQISHLKTPPHPFYRALAAAQPLPAAPQPRSAAAAPEMDVKVGVTAA